MIASDGSNEGQPAGELQRLVLAVEAAGRTILPRSNDILLKSIVEAAARIFGAAAASILLVDEGQRMLEFKVTFGAADRDLVGTRFPLDQGIAGYVAMTAQPIAVSDVQQDARFNQEFARSTGYVPRSILATPLLADDRVLGVMEVLDKLNAPSFGMQDMELLGMFAHQAAIAIDLSQQMDRIGEALVQGLERLAPPAEGAAIARVAPEASDLLSLADLFADIATLGEAERHACRQILAAFADYARSTSRLRRI